MRWFWIDRFTEFVSGSRATAVKNVALSEEYLHDHFPGAPVMPNSLILEGMAQTAGLLVSEYNDFAERVVLAKVARSLFHFHARPGDTLTYQATIQLIRKDGAMVTTTSHLGSRLQGEAEVFFAHLDDQQNQRVLFEPADLLTWLQMLEVFRVGRNADGSPLQVPPTLAEPAPSRNDGALERDPIEGGPIEGGPSGRNAEPGQVP